MLRWLRCRAPASTLLWVLSFAYTLLSQVSGGLSSQENPPGFRPTLSYMCRIAFPYSVLTLSYTCLGGILFGPGPPFHYSQFRRAPKQSSTASRSIDYIPATPRHEALRESGLWPAKRRGGSASFLAPAPSAPADEVAAAGAAPSFISCPTHPHLSRRLFAWRVTRFLFIYLFVRRLSVMPSCRVIYVSR